MKKTFSNIRTLAALLMAGAAFAACSSDENIIEQQPVSNGEQVYTLTIKATKGEDVTRALELDNPSSPTSALHAKWTTTDNIAVLKGGSTVGSLTPSDISTDGQKATFTGTITGSIAESDVLTLAYHPVPNISAFAAQDGTLDDAGNFDSAIATVTVATIIDNGSSKDITVVGGSATFETQTAVLKLTLTNGTLPINATTLKMTAMDQEILTFSPTASTYSTNGDGILYFSLPSKTAVATALASKLGYSVSTISTMLSSSEITFIANGGKNFIVKKTGYPFEAAKYYATTLNMTECGSFYNVTSSGTVNGTPVNESMLKQTMPLNTSIDALIGAMALSGATISQVTVVSGPIAVVNDIYGSSITLTGEGTAVLCVEYNLGMGNSSDNITVTVTPMPVAEGHDLASSLVGEIVGSDGLAYSADDADNLPSGVSAVALVAYKGTSDGLAISLTDYHEGSVYEFNWGSAYSGCLALAPVGGHDWHLPSQYEWEAMLGNYGSWAAFQTAAKLTTTAYYWSTTDMTEGEYYALQPDGTFFQYTGTMYTYYARAVLSW